MGDLTPAATLSPLKTRELDALDARVVDRRVVRELRRAETLESRLRWNLAPCRKPEVYDYA